jgi:diguanylate cyclase (GGDEF)-like protein
VIARIRYHSRAYINLLEKNEACARLSVLVNNEQERSRELALLAEMSELLHGCGKEADTYTILKDIYCRLLPFASGSIAIFDTTSERFEIAEAWGESFCSGEAFEKQDCLAMRRFQMHTVNEPDKSTTCAHISSTAAACYLCQPIISQSEPIGVICLGIHRNCLNEDEPDIKKKFTAKQSIIGRMAEFYTLSLINFRLCDTLRMRSLHDPLTGLYNRRYMEQTLNREIDRAKRNHCHLGVAMLDIDHFKTFNDTYGHDVGDLILRRLGTHLLDSIRTTDIACRYGGEEFLLIMGDISLQNLAHKIETLLAGIKNELKIEHDNQLLSVTISAGIGCFPDHGESIEEIIKAADQSLYRAKANGRDRLEIAPVPSDVSEKQDNALPGGSVPGI